MITALISCSARKLDRPATARDLYTGTLFRYALQSWKRWREGFIDQHKQS